MIQPAQSAPSGSRVWDRAVEAAAKARFEDTFSDPDDPKWDEIDAAERQGWLDVMRVALAAGLPLLLDDLAERIEAWADERAAMAERHATDRELSRDFESESDGAMLVARLVRSYAGEVQR